MRMANSAAMPDREDGTGHPAASPAAAVGKHRVNKAGQATGIAVVRGLIFAIVTLVAPGLSGSASYAQSGPFAGMAGNWSGGGTVSLDDGSTERIRCRAAYASAAGFNANLPLTTRGSRQSVAIRAENGFRGATITLNRSSGLPDRVSRPA